MSRRRRALRLLGIGLLVSSGALAATWYGVNHVPGFGPWLADSLRVVLGTKAVEKLEETAYGLADRWKGLTRRGEIAKSHWQVPEAPSSSGSAAPVPAREFLPADVGPLFRNVSAAGDGVWVRVPIPTHPSESPLLYKTLIHPDRKRPWAELFVVAIDLRRARLHVQAGTVEPKSHSAAGRAHARTGLVRPEHLPMIVAAFNGGFKAEHGQYGMRVGGVTLLPARPGSCTIGGAGEELRIGTWTALGLKDDSGWWWRQTPPCLVERGALHTGLGEESRGWGAALGGDTVVRRSAMGLDRAGHTLYFAVSNDTTARAIGLGMHHVGADAAAQLDINWSYPQVVLFRMADAGLTGFGLFEGFVVDPDEYIRKPSARDFFYLTVR